MARRKTPAKTPPITITDLEKRPKNERWAPCPKCGGKLSSSLLYVIDVGYKNMVECENVTRPEPTCDYQFVLEESSSTL